MEYIQVFFQSVFAGLIAVILLVTYAGALCGGFYLIENLVKKAFDWIEKKLEKWADKHDEKN